MIPGTLVHTTGRIRYSYTRVRPVVISSAAVTGELLRGTIVNRTYGIHTNLYIYLILTTLFGPI